VKGQARGKFPNRDIKAAIADYLASQTYQLIEVRRQRIDRLIDSASMLAGRLSVDLMTDLVPQLLPQLRKTALQLAKDIDQLQDMMETTCLN
jgi:hypothetical protein